MPTDYQRAVTPQDGDDILASHHNDNQEALEEYLNVTGVKKVQADAEHVNTYYEDSQGANIEWSGALPDLSITPAAGTYFAFATAQLNTGTQTILAGVCYARLAVRVAGANVIVGPAAGGRPDPDHSDPDVYNLTAQGIVTVNGSQAVDVYGEFLQLGTAGRIISFGKLVLVRLGE